MTSIHRYMLPPIQGTPLALTKDETLTIATFAWPSIYYDTGAPRPGDLLVIPKHPLPLAGYSGGWKQNYDYVQGGTLTLGPEIWPSLNTQLRTGSYALSTPWPQSPVWEWNIGDEPLTACNLDGDGFVGPSIDPPPSAVIEYQIDFVRRDYTPTRAGFVVNFRNELKEIALSTNWAGEYKISDGPPYYVAMIAAVPFFGRFTVYLSEGRPGPIPKPPGGAQLLWTS